MAPSPNSFSIDSKRQRFYFQRGTSSNIAHVAWFTLEDTHDLYWGSPSNALDQESQALEFDDANRTTISAPDDWEAAPKVPLKHSYHASGFRHTTAGGSGLAAIPDSFAGRPDALVQPVLLCAVLSKIPARYTPYRRNLNRHHSRAVVMQLSDDLWFNYRHYLEFFLSPSGQVDWPMPLLNLDPLTNMLFVGVSG